MRWSLNCGRGNPSHHHLRLEVGHTKRTEATWCRGEGGIGGWLGGREERLGGGGWWWGFISWSCGGGLGCLRERERERRREVEDGISEIECGRAESSCTRYRCCSTFAEIHILNPLHSQLKRWRDPEEHHQSWVVFH